ncbi:MAG: hypothetical protein QGG14_07890 [Planctomycetota bacterium]|jgi:hypothetical protein|nr:hypothetical protein [Planctomycetota bacterium]
MSEASDLFDIAVLSQHQESSAPGFFVASETASGKKAVTPARRTSSQ